jgi:hypothetical protein
VFLSIYKFISEQYFWNEDGDEHDHEYEQGEGHNGVTDRPRSWHGITSPQLVIGKPSSSML